MKKTSLFLASFVLLCSLVVIPVQSFATGNTGDGTISTYAAIIEWRVKIINGHFYKRQYNHTTQKWIGEWIRMY